MALTLIQWLFGINSKEAYIYSMRTYKGRGLGNVTLMGGGVCMRCRHFQKQIFRYDIL